MQQSATAATPTATRTQTKRRICIQHTLIWPSQISDGMRNRIAGIRLWVSFSLVDIQRFLAARLHGGNGGCQQTKTGGEIL